jgi:hypothetical protein
MMMIIAMSCFDGQPSLSQNKKPTVVQTRRIEALP